MRNAVVSAGEAALWWAVTLGVWLLTLSSVTAADLLVAASCSLPCGVAAVAARRVLGGHWPFPSRAGAWSLRLPLAVAADTVRVLALPWQRVTGRRGDEGTFARVPVAPGADGRSVTRRAAAVILLSMSPGSFAVHDDADTGELLVHSLVGGRTGMESVVRR